MYVIKMEDDKSLITTVKSTVYHKEANANHILFLLPQVIDECRVADFDVRMDYLPANSVGESEFLVLEKDSYKGYLQFSVPIDTKITNWVGVVEIWLSLVGLDGGVVVKSGSVYLDVEERKQVTDYYPPERLEALDRLSIDVLALRKGKADNLTYDEDEHYLQLLAEGHPIGNKISAYTIVDGVDSLIDFSGEVENDPSDPDKVIEF